jgi:hypothetical protein
MPNGAVKRCLARLGGTDRGHVIVATGVARLQSCLYVSRVSEQLLGCAGAQDQEKGVRV